MQEPAANPLARIVDQIDLYRAGQLTARGALNNIWGLYTAAEAEGAPKGREFEALFRRRPTYGRP